ncbi:MAG: YbjN domain-containing protein [Acidimicrobiales bacterium]|nr:YbjN domain-containing protein [Acidimicrobiales bacterium]
MSAEPASPAELDVVEARISAWLGQQLADNPVVAAVDRGEPGERRWYVRLRGEEKDVSTIWLTLGQRTLHHETYVLPAPMEQHARFYEHLLRRNYRLYGVQFAIGPEDAVYLVGQVPVASLDEAELDRVVGTVYATVEQTFRPALRIGFGSHLPGR